jgi:two-component system sensor histidine kinase AgrC
MDTLKNIIISSGFSFYILIFYNRFSSVKSIFIKILFFICNILVFFITHHGDLELFVCIFILFLFLKIFDKKSFKDSFVLSLVICISFTLFLNLLNSIFQHIFSILDRNTLLKFHFLFISILLFISNILSIFLSKILKKIYDTLTKSTIDNKTKYLSIGLLLTSFTFILLLNTYLTFHVDLKNNLYKIFYVVIFSIAIVITFLTSILYTRYRINKRVLKQKNNELKNLENYSENIETLYNKINTLRHDYKNILLSINCYLEENKTNELKEYYNKILLNSNNIFENYDYLTSIKKIKSMSFKGLLSSKFLYASSIGLNIFCDINFEVENDLIDEIDKINLFNSIITNAIFEATQSETRNLIIKILSINNYNIYKIINSCSKENKEKVNNYLDKKIINKYPKKYIKITSNCSTNENISIIKLLTINNKAS